MRTLPIIDTNVVVAGLLTRDAASPVARILDGMLGAAFPFALSEALLAEYRKVLVRPALRRLHGLKVNEVETILTDLVHHAIILKQAVALPAPDPGDQFLWDLLLSSRENNLIDYSSRGLKAVCMSHPQLGRLNRATALLHR